MASRAIEVIIGFVINKMRERARTLSAAVQRQFNFIGEKNRESASR